MVSLIPKELLAKAKGGNISPERVIEVLPQIINSPLLFVYVLVDDASKIKGVFWFSLSLFTKRFHVKLLVVDDEYQDRTALNECRAFLMAVREELKQKYNWEVDTIIECSTSRPKAFKRQGWIESKKVAMEIDNDII
jgi:hypothetical protein